MRPGKTAQEVIKGITQTDTKKQSYGTKRCLSRQPGMLHYRGPPAGEAFVFHGPSFWRPCQSPNVEQVWKFPPS